MIKHTLLSLALMSTLLFQGCSDSDEKQEKQTLKQEQGFILQTSDNTQLTLKKTAHGFLLKEQPNKLLLLDIFATWCPPCQASASHLSALEKKFGDAIKIVGISIEAGLPHEQLINFANQNHATYTLSTAQQTRKLLDTIAQELHLGNSFGIPLLAIYKDGKLVKFYQGAIEEEFLQSDIKNILGK